MKPRKGRKGRPRTLRLDKEDDRWVDQQKHADGFSGVMGDAIKLYRRIKDEQSDTQRARLLESVR